MWLNSRDSEYKCPKCLKYWCNWECSDKKLEIIDSNERKLFYKFYEKIEHICPDCRELKCKCDIIKLEKKCPKCLKYWCNWECSDILEYDLKSREILELLNLLEWINTEIMSWEEIVWLWNHIVSIWESKENFWIFIKENEEHFDLKKIVDLDDRYNKIIDIFVTLDKVIEKLELKKLKLLWLISGLKLTLQKNLNSSNQDNIKWVLIRIWKEIILLGNEIRDLEINKKELEIKSWKY